MPTAPSKRRVARHILVLAACVLGASPAWVQAAGHTATSTTATSTTATPTTATPAKAAAANDAEAAYREARARCLSGSSQQDRATCLKEAGAVRAERQSGRVDASASAATLQANALKRCEAQPPQARGECERLARGEGSQEGSVKGGGVIKEIVTQVPAVAASAAVRR